MISRSRPDRFSILAASVSGSFTIPTLPSASFGHLVYSILARFLPAALFKASISLIIELSYDPSYDTDLLLLFVIVVVVVIIIMIVIE